MPLRDYCTHTFFIPKVYRFLDNDSTLAFLSTFFWYPIQNEGVFEEYYLVVLYFGAGARSLLLLGWHFWNIFGWRVCPRKLSKSGFVVGGNTEMSRSRLPALGNGLVRNEAGLLPRGFRMTMGVGAHR